MPVLSYLPVFGQPSPNLRRIETRAVHGILHFPHNAITLSAVGRLHKRGCPQICSAAALCIAAPVRFAKPNLLALHKLLEDLCCDAKCHGNIRLLTQGNVSPKAWKTIPVAEHLLSIMQGQDVAFQFCNLGIAALLKLAKQTADEQRQSAAIKISSKLSQSFDNMDPQPPSNAEVPAAENP